MGRYGGRKGLHSAPSILGMIGRGAPARYLGALGILAPLLVNMYYVLIEAWCLRYFLAYLTGSLDLGSDPTQYAARSADFFRAISGDGANGLIPDGGTGLAFLLFVIGFNLWFIRRGLAKGIETFCKIAMPALIVCALIVLVRVLTLGTPDPAGPTRMCWPAWASCGTPTCLIWATSRPGWRPPDRSFSASGSASALS